MKEEYIWVVGANGLLGSTFCRYLQRKNINFISSTFGEVDICKQDQINKFSENKRITHIINCAAYTQVDLAEKEKEKAFEVNSKAPLYLAKMAKRKKAKFIHFSTDYVFDGKKTFSYIESDVAAPINVYGKSKLKGEKEVQKEFPSSCIIRTSWLFGDGNNNFVTKMMDLMQRKKSLSIVDDQIGRPTYAEDLVEAAMLLRNKEGIYHFANLGHASWHDMALFLYQQMIGKGHDLICKSISPIKTNEYPSFAYRPLYSPLNTEKFEKVANKKPRTWQKAMIDFLRNIKNEAKS